MSKKASCKFTYELPSGDIRTGFVRATGVSDLASFKELVIGMKLQGKITDYSITDPALDHGTEATSGSVNYLEKINFKGEKADGSVISLYVQGNVDMPTKIDRYSILTDLSACKPFEVLTTANVEGFSVPGREYMKDVGAVTP